MLKFQRKSDGKLIVQSCAIAKTVLDRLKGLIGSKELKQNEGLWIIPCHSIHMFFMKYSIDAIFLNKKLQVIALYPQLKPWSFSGMHFKAKSVLEIHSGNIQSIGLKLGDELEAYDQEGRNFIG